MDTKWIARLIAYEDVIFAEIQGLVYPGKTQCTTCTNF